MGIVNDLEDAMVAFLSTVDSMNLLPIRARKSVIFACVDCSSLAIVMIGTDN